ncbi:MAG: hypothetical protein ACRERU_04785 [Methylococcales bacterium]
MNDSTDAEKFKSSQELLLFKDVMGPELYRRNPFRVTELPVLATGRDIQKRIQMVEMAVKTQVATPAGTGRALPLPEAPSPDQLRDALQQLNDPQKRLIAELFWFWPMEMGSAKTDLNLEALRRGDVETARTSWTNDEQFAQRKYWIAGRPEKMAMAVHNLAVLNHEQAMDFESIAQSQTLTYSERKRRDRCWKDAIRYWKLVATVDAFWKRLLDRINTLDDPRLTEESCHQIRTALPESLLTINAQFAVRAAEAGAAKESRRHIALLSSSDFPTSAIDIALEAAVAPIRERIKALLKAGDAEVDADAVCAAEVARRVLDQSEALLNVLDTVLTAEHPVAEAAHDEIALGVSSCLIAYANKTSNWDVALALAERCLPVVRGESARHRIEENRDTMRTNCTHGTCYFCGQNQNDEQYAIPIEMYGEVVHTPINYHDFYRDVDVHQVRLNWRTLTVKVPRCVDCNQKHDMAKKIHETDEKWRFLIPIVFIGFYIISILYFRDLDIVFRKLEFPLTNTDIVLIIWANMNNWVHFLLVVAVLVLFCFSNNLYQDRKLRKLGIIGIKNIYETNNFFDVQKLLKKGWKFGTGPSS